MTDWFARPVLHVSSVEATPLLCGQLGFRVAWRHEEDGRARVAHRRSRGLRSHFADQWPEKVTSSPERYEVEVEDLDIAR